jgi:ribosomal protein L16/L10AE
VRRLHCLHTCAAQVVVYVRQGVTSRQLAQDALRRFEIKLPRPVKVRCIIS